MDGSLPTNQELLEQKSQTAGSSGITGNGSLGGSLKPATSHNCRASDSGVHPAEGLSPVREKGVQMKSKSGCASRSDAGNMSTAYDLCTLRANIRFRSEKVCRKNADKSCRNIPTKRVGIFLHSP